MSDVPSSVVKGGHFLWPDAESGEVKDKAAPHKYVDNGYFKCVSCGTRYWHKNKLIRRSAKCKGVRYDHDGTRQRCKAWRCRYNDQCTAANDACPLCGAFKPPEFQPTQPAHDCRPAHSPRPFSPAYADQFSASQPSDQSYAVPPARYLQEQSEHFFAQESASMSQCTVPKGTITQLPLSEGMTQRFLTEV